ncbi:MAG: hypothetical protein R6V03_03640 [Kiritimatiellia bacterium]
MKDSVVQDIRKVRKEIEDECMNRREPYASHVLKEQEKCADRLVRRSPQERVKEKIA